LKKHNLFRRINRGVLLAAVLLIGLILYLIIDNLSFAGEKDAIKDMLFDYAEAAETAMILPADVRKPGEKISEDIINKKINESKVALGKYLTYSVS